MTNKNGKVHLHSAASRGAVRHRRAGVKRRPQPKPALTVFGL